jgi:sulfonate transport system substrate-binding protein
MINRFIDRLSKRIGKRFLQLLKSILGRSRSTALRSPTHKFAILFCIGFVSIGILSLAFNSSAETTSQANDNALSLLGFKFPKTSTPRLIETIGLFVGGILFCVALDRWFSKRSAPTDNTPLASQARKLKQLKIGYPEGMTNLEVLRSQGFLEQRLRPFGLTVTWSSFLSASSLTILRTKLVRNGTIGTKLLEIRV